MSLDFMTPRGTVAESPMAGAVKGATRGEHAGWNVAQRFAGVDSELDALAKTVGWIDMSHLPKFELTHQQNTAFGIATPDAGGWRCPLTADRTLIVGATTEEPGAVDVTTQFAAMVIEGPLARETIARFCALDLRPAVAPPHSLLPGSIARTPGLLVVEDADRFLLVVGAAYGEYFWQVVTDAGAHLGGRPVGLEAELKGQGADA